MDNGVDTGIVWWQVYPLGFCGAPVRPTSEGERTLTSRLDRLGAWLDYAADMGVGGLMLNPLFASETHGYDTTDYFRIDPRLGDDASFDRLVSACHERGLRVMLDGVFNHVGRSHLLFQDALTGRGNEGFREFVWVVASLPWRRGGRHRQAGTQECTQIGENGLSALFWGTCVHCCAVVDR